MKSFIFHNISTTFCSTLFVYRKTHAIPRSDEKSITHHKWTGSMVTICASFCGQTARTRGLVFCEIDLHVGPLLDLYLETNLDKTEKSLLSIMIVT